MKAADYPFFDSRFAAIAHRGGFGSEADRGRENTLYAFSQAVRNGYRYLETDVHTSSDGVLFAFHDNRLDRITDGAGVPERLPWSELRAVRVAGIDPIPTLDELFETFPAARFNLDLKVSSAIIPLARAIDAHRANDRVCVASFSSARLRAFRRLTRGRVATAVGPIGVAWQAFAPIGRRLIHSPGVVLQIPRSIWGGRIPLATSNLVRAAHASGRAVHVWTVNEPDEMERLIELGVDGLVTDRIAVLAAVLRARGLWDGEDA